MLSAYPEEFLAAFSDEIVGRTASVDVQLLGHRLSEVSDCLVGVAVRPARIHATMLPRCAWLKFSV